LPESLPLVLSVAIRTLVLSRLVLSVVAPMLLVVDTPEPLLMMKLVGSISHSPLLPSAARVDTTQKMSFGGARSVRAYAPGVLSGDSGHLLTAEIKHRLTPIGKAVTVSDDLYASVFIDAGWLTLYQNPYASGSNQARLAGAGVGLSWEGPRYWRASFSISQPIGNAPSQLSGSSYLHANAWLEVSKGFR
jgi:hypothetical protein